MTAAHVTRWVAAMENWHRAASVLAHRVLGKVMKGGLLPRQRVA